MYQIVRMYQDGRTPKRIIKKSLTLKEAQAHCRDSESSSSTCTTSAGKARTRSHGPWFDGYEDMPKTREEKAFERRYEKKYGRKFGAG